MARSPRTFANTRLKLDLQPRPPNVPLLRALWSLLDGISGLLKGSWGVLEADTTSSVFVLLQSKDSSKTGRAGREQLSLVCGPLRFQEPTWDFSPF